MESGAVASSVLNKGTRWKLVVSVTPRPFFPHRKSPGAYWVGLSVGVDSVVEGSLSYPYTLGIWPTVFRVYASISVDTPTVRCRLYCVQKDVNRSFY